MSRIFILIILFSFGTAFANEPLITINQFAHHRALDLVAEGVEQGLKEQGINAEIIKENAQGNIIMSVQIASHLASLNPKIMVAISTNSAQTTLKARKDKNITIAFAAVSDPKAAGLEMAENIIGVADIPPVEELIKEAKILLPTLKKIGILFNPSEINSINTIKRMKLAAPEMKYFEVAVNSSNDVIQASKNLVSKVDLIYLPQDNTVVSAIDVIAKIASQNNIPLISNDPSLSEKGVLLALGCNYFASGKQLADMMSQTIKTGRVNVIEKAKTIEKLINQAKLEALKK